MMIGRGFLWLVPALVLAGCKTTGSHAAAFTINGDAAAAHRLIVQSVLNAYPSVAANQAVVEQFATALQDGNTAQAAHSDFLLQQAYAKLQSPDPSQFTEFDAYVEVEFVALTNYASVLKNPGTALTYTGTTQAAQ